MSGSFTTRRVDAAIRLEIPDFRRTLGGLRASDWIPAVAAAEITFLELAGISSEFPLRIARDQRMRYQGQGHDVFSGEVFFKENAVYYAMTFPDGLYRAARYYQWAGRLAAVSNNPLIELGLISSDADNIDANLREFVDAFQKAVMDCVDGRKTRHMSFRWMVTKPGHLLPSRIEEGEGDDAESSFKRAELASDAVEASIFLAENLARKVLRELSRAVFARERDILNKWAKRHHDVRDMIERAKKANLIESEVIVECRQTGAPLSRICSDAANQEGLQSIRCPSCGRLFHEEQMTEAYSLSELGKSLLRSSHWMTIWMTNELVKLGVQQESILWNLNEAGEEVDIIAEYMENLWIFELKDREFGAGDAYPFNYRKARYRAHRAIIVSTEKISKDAKRIFTELSRETRAAVSARELTVTSEPVYVEGLAEAGKVLREEMAKSALSYAAGRLEILGLHTGFDLTRVLVTRFGLAT